MALPISAVVPTYRPTASTIDLINVLTGEVDNLLVSDDASPCTSDSTLRTIASKSRLTRHHTNSGIARALNEGLRLARSQGHEWLLTMDQDSSIHETYVQRLYDFAREVTSRNVDVGVIAPQLIQVHTQNISYPEYENNGLLTTHEVFQSGALWNVSALERVGGFDERLGMDAVDAAACLRLREHRCLIVLAPGLVLQHAWGNAEFVKVAGRSIALTHHSPERRRTIVRNRIRLAPAEFRQSPIHGFRTLRRLAVGTTLAIARESRKREKVAATLAGIRGATKR